MALPIRRHKFVGLRETEASSYSLSYYTKGALLTTAPLGQRWYCLRQPCALRGRCGSCGSLMSNATSRRCCCHCPRSWWSVLPPIQNTDALTDGIPQTARINLPLAALFAAMGIAMGIAPRNAHFLFLRKRGSITNFVGFRIPHVVSATYIE